MLAYILFGLFKGLTSTSSNEVLPLRPDLFMNYGTGGKAGIAKPSEDIARTISTQS